MRLPFKVVLLAATLILTLAPAVTASSAPGHDEPSLIAGPPKGLVTSITTLVIFALLLAVLGKFAWGPIASGLKAREERIRRDIADAEAARARAEATLREYNARLATAEQKVRDMLAGATAQGEQIAAEINARAQHEAEEARQRAMREIDAAGKHAITEIYDKAAEISTSIAEKILRRNINANDQRDLVQESLNQLESTRA